MYVFVYGLRIGVAVAVAVGAFFLSDFRVTTMVDEYSGAIDSEGVTLKEEKGLEQ